MTFYNLLTSTYLFYSTPPTLHCNKTHTKEARKPNTFFLCSALLAMMLCTPAGHSLQASVALPFAAQVAAVHLRWQSPWLHYAAGISLGALMIGAKITASQRRQHILGDPTPPAPWLLPPHAFLDDDREDATEQEGQRPQAWWQTSSGREWDDSLEQAAELISDPHFSSQQHSEARRTLGYFSHFFQLDDRAFIRKLKKKGNLLEALVHAIPPRRYWSYQEATTMLPLLQRQTVKDWYIFQQISEHGRGSRWAYLAQNLLPPEIFRPGYLTFSWHAFPYTKQNLIEIHLKTWALLHKKDPLIFYEAILSRERLQSALKNTPQWEIRYPWQVVMLILLLTGDEEMATNYKQLEEQQGFAMGPFIPTSADLAEEWLIWQKRPADQKRLAHKKMQFWQQFIQRLPQNVQSLQDKRLRSYFRGGMELYQSISAP